MRQRHLIFDRKLKKKRVNLTVQNVSINTHMKSTHGHTDMDRYTDMLQFASFEVSRFKLQILLFDTLNFVKRKLFLKIDLI